MFFFSPSQAAKKLAEIYDSIANEFSESRNSPWEEAEVLFAATPKNAKILDIGCGNGRLVPLFLKKNCEVFGGDISEKLLGIAQKKYPAAHFQKVDFSDLPFADETFDEVWSVASFHHIPTEKKRLRALSEMCRVLKPKGEVIIIVWNLWNQQKYARQKRWSILRSFLIPTWSKRDFIIPWGTEKKTRYYHSFDVQELQKLAEKSGFLVKELFGWRKGGKEVILHSQNICIRLQKKSSLLC
ncbi:class I SAM-dependent methyltransferase [Candidatus Peregrinibacteria bacterium]|nr:class I SAM-dependent methyltransferase [Candidatus Peregrinibacteria bacterium]